MEDDKLTWKKQGGSEPSWEKAVIEKLVFAAVKEQRKQRRWGIFFKSLTFIYLLFFLSAVLGPMIPQAINTDGAPFVGVVNISGVIADGEEASADRIIEGLRAAAGTEGIQAIILKMNTPGGSPVQSAYVYDEIVSIKKQHNELAIYAVVTDICASGGYYIAAASDKIYVNESSMIGSIGVLINGISGFGFVDAMNNLGIERRLLTAGSHKGLLDPFSPLKPEEESHVKGLLSELHQTFISAVKEGRGSRLADNQDLFSGLIWTGKSGIELGLADGLGSVSSVAREVVGTDKIIDFTPKKKLVDEILGQVEAAGNLFRSMTTLVQGGGAFN